MQIQVQRVQVPNLLVINYHMPAGPPLYPKGVPGKPLHNGFLTQMNEKRSESSSIVNLFFLAGGG